jgi:hypothetical protein
MKEAECVLEINDDRGDNDARFLWDEGVARGDIAIGVLGDSI